MARLRCSSQEIRCKLSSQDDQLAAFLQLIDSTSQDLTLQSTSQQEMFRKFGAELSSIATGGSEAIAEHAQTAFKKSLESVQDLSKIAEQYLTKQLGWVKREKEEEHLVLQHEVRGNQYSLGSYD